MVNVLWNFFCSPININTCISEYGSIQNFFLETNIISKMLDGQAVVLKVHNDMVDFNQNVLKVFPNMLCVILPCHRI